MSKAQLAQKSQENQPNWIIIGVLAFLGAIVFFYPFLSVVCLAAIMAVLFYPFYTWLTKRLKPGVAAPITLVVSILAVIIPIAIVILMAVSQGLTFANNAAQSIGDTSVQDSIEPLLETVNGVLAPLTGGVAVITEDGLTAFLKEALPNMLQFIANTLLAFVSSLPIFLTSIILFGFLMNSFLMFAPAIGRAIATLSPFDRTYNQLYAERASSIVKASLGGQFLISIVTAVSSAFLLIFLGLGDYFMFFVIIFTLLGMIPLGSGILMIPICIFAILTGNVVPGLWVLAIYLIVVCNFDNFMRPRLIPKNAKLLPAMTILATFSGIYYFGLLGIIYGPVIAILFTTTLEAFTHYRQGIRTAADLKKA